jgi:hypothetical protein
LGKLGRFEIGSQEGVYYMQVVLLIVFFIALLIALPFMMNKRAIRQVIKRFRDRQALDPSTAKTIDELGLTPPSFRERLMRFRDYKPAALNGLVRIGIVQVTEDGRFYLSEEKLGNTRIANF